MLKELFTPANRYGNLRSAINSASEPPVIPYFGIFIGDLEKIESLNNETLDEQNQKLMNFNKKRLCTKMIRTIQTYQSHCNYQEKYKKIDFIHNGLKHFISPSNESQLWDDDKLFQESTRLEPPIATQAVE